MEAVLKVVPISTCNELHTTARCILCLGVIIDRSGTGMRSLSFWWDVYFLRDRSWPCFLEPVV